MVEKVVLCFVTGVGYVLAVVGFLAIIAGTIGLFSILDPHPLAWLLAILPAGMLLFWLGTKLADDYDGWAEPISQWVANRLFRRRHLCLL